jgi:hypothetical protein
VNGSVPAEFALVALLVVTVVEPGLVPLVPLLTDSHVCGAYAWHVELELASAAPGTIKASTAKTPTSAEMRFMNPFTFVARPQDHY